MLFGGLAATEIGPHHFRLLITGWKVKFAHNTVVANSKALARIADAIGKSTGNPNPRAMLPRTAAQRTRGVIATPQELSRLLATAPPWLHAAILLGAHAGFRRSDILRICPAHFHLPTCTITIDMKKTGRKITVPASEDLAQVFASVADRFPHTPLLELLRGKPVTAFSFDRHWQALKRSTAVNPQLWIHDLRRTLAVSLYEASKDLRVVEQMLGHQSLASTIQYLEHRDPEKLKPYLDSILKTSSRFIQ